MKHNLRFGPVLSRLGCLEYMNFLGFSNVVIYVGGTVTSYILWFSILRLSLKKKPFSKVQMIKTEAKRKTEYNSVTVAPTYTTVFEDAHLTKNF